MELKQQITNFVSRLPFRKWKVWAVIAIMTTSLLLSSCSKSTEDYKTDLGDPSLYKERYIQAEREVKSLRKEVDNKIKENTKLKEKYAELKARKLKDLDLSEREKALDEREKNLAERENQIKQDQARADNAKDEIFDKSLEIGKKIGQLDKDEQRIKELSKELSSLKNQQKTSAIMLTMLIFALILVITGLGLYIFLDKYGVLKPKASEKDASVSDKTIDVKDITPNNKLSNSGALNQTKDSDLKALPSETPQ